MSEIYRKSFAYSADEALVSAKWETGVRNLAQPLSLALLAAVALIEVVRRLAGLPAPDWTFLALDAAAVALFLIFLNAADKKTRECARGIQARSFELELENGELRVTEGGERVYRCAVNEISRVEAGPKVLRLTSPAGSICLPGGAMPEGFPAMLRERLGKDSFKIRNWM